MSSWLLARARIPFLVVAVLIVLAVGSGWAIAASTISTATLHACASKRTGVLRLASKCKSSERSVSWNTVGPRGPRGLQGAKGDTGATGVSGAKGDAGAKGDTGAAGTARAYGYVDTTCTGGTGQDCGLFKSKNITRVYRPSTGIYCIVPAVGSAISAADVLIVTVDFLHTNSPESDAAALSDEQTNGSCNTTTELSVITERAGGAKANDIAFSFAIP